MWSLLLLACVGRPPAPTPGNNSAPASDDADALSSLVLPGAGPVRIEMEDGRFTVVDTSTIDTGVSGDGTTTDPRYIVPAFIDSHVHLAYRSGVDEMLEGGVAAVVDLAAPVDFLSADTGALEVIAAGPMVTAVGGYPTASWGAGGYGLECEDAAAATEAVRTLHAAGARVIKLPITDRVVLDDAALTAATTTAHDLGLLTVTHALNDSNVARGARIGADVLAHTPTATLDDATVAAWGTRAVISTLAAFGGGTRTVDNLRTLRTAGATVLYGTDYGNTTRAGIDPAEIALLQAAGLDGAAIVAAGTSTPASFWGLDHLGAIETGRNASFLVLDADPHIDPSTLGRPVQVWIDGIRRH